MFGLFVMICVVGVWFIVIVVKGFLYYSVVSEVVKWEMSDGKGGK